MKQAKQQMIPRQALYWLLVAQLLVIAPHLLHIPLWIAGLWLGCALWCVQLYRMRARFPGSLVKAGLMCSAGFAVYLSRGSLVGLDAGTALLVTAFVLKLVELRSRRDALVLIFLGLFTVVTGYLYADSLLAALYSLLPVAALLTAWIALEQGSTATVGQPAWRTSLVLLLQALPLALLLFVFFPRLDPLWSLPQPGERALSGLSDSMSPGDIAELSQSSALAFRASFAGAVPPKAELYWRALTLPYFDGRSWQRGRSGADLLPPRWQPQGEPLDYEVIMQPTQRPWLFSLDISQTEHPQIRQLADYRLQRNSPVRQAWLYQARAWPLALADPGMGAKQQRMYLQLPAGANPKTRAWAQSLAQQHGNSGALVAAMLQHFNREPYYYTLRPPKLGAHSVDEFMFDTKRGFCEHYAGAMTFALRAAGVPARVVTGYQGGELNSTGNFVQVRQMDAHAWVEYWQQGLGWQRVDPTFQVAPQRIELGLEDALQDEAEWLNLGPLSPMSYRHLAWVNSLRMGWDNLNHQWQSKVLGYQRDRQEAWLKQWFGRLDWQAIGLTTLALLGLCVALLSLWLFKPWRERPSPEQLLLQRFDSLLRRSGLPRQSGEGLQGLYSRLAPKLDTEARSQLAQWVQNLEQHLYADQPLPLVQLKQQLKNLARALAAQRRSKRNN